MPEDNQFNPIRSYGHCDIKTSLLIFVTLNLVLGFSPYSFNQFGSISALFSTGFSILGFYTVSAELIQSMQLFKFYLFYSLAHVYVVTVNAIILVNRLYKPQNLDDHHSNPYFYTYFYIWIIISFLFQNFIKIMIIFQIGRFCRYLERKNDLERMMNTPLGYGLGFGSDTTIQLPPYTHQSSKLPRYDELEDLN
jgi:hypothetical protein